ncbi:ash family protein [Serratia sp. IR-2025]
MYFLANLRHSDSASAKSDAGICTPESHSAHDTRLACFLFVRPSSTLSMVGWAGQPQGWPVPCDAGSANPVQFTTSEICTSGGEF